MGHYLPVFYFPLSAAEAELRFDTWHDAQECIVARANSGEGELWTAYSQNWWHELALGRIMDALALAGLDFVSHDVARLDSDDALTAASSLDALLAALPDALFHPDLPDDADLARLRANGYLEAFASASASHDVDLPPMDSTNPDAFTFFAYVRSLRSALQAAIDRGTGFLYVRPQP
jgi:hypothetical protein